MNDDLVLLKIFRTRLEAEIAKSVLLTNNIKAVVLGDDGGGAYPFPAQRTFGIELKVREKDLKKAKKILS